MSLVQKWILAFLFMSGVVFSSTVLARPQNECLVPSSVLLDQRITILKNYFNFLGHGQYKEIIPLFSSNAMVSDTVTGLSPAQKYYAKLSTYLTGPQMTLYDFYIGLKNPNIIAVHFNMKIKTKNGIENRGEIVDLFEFEKDSTKITKLYIQGNKTAFPFS